MSVQIVRAQDIQTNLSRPVPERVHAVAQWALPKIAENYVAQEALIERKVGEAEEEAKRLKAVVRERGQVLRTWVILAGVLLAAAVVLLGFLVFREDLKLGLFGPGGEAGLVWGGGGGVVLIGVVVLVLGIDRQRRANLDSIDGDLEDEKARLRDVEGELEPDAVLRVGRVYWAFELVKHPNGRCIPVNLAATRGGGTVQIWCPRASPPGEPPDDRDGAPDDAPLPPGLSGALDALDGFKSDLASWRMESDLRLPVLRVEGELERELDAVLRYGTVTSDSAPGPVIGEGGMTAALDEGAPRYTAGWQRCLVQGEDWIASLEDLRDGVKRAAAHGVAALQDMPGPQGQPAPLAAADGTSLSDWAPDVSDVLEELQARCAELEERLRTGIESKEGKTLLEELQRVLQEINHRPWADVVDPLKEMKRAYSKAVDASNNVAAQLGVLSSLDSDLSRRQQSLTFAEQSIRDLAGKIGQLDADLNSVRRDAQALRESARHMQTTLDNRFPRRLRDTPFDASRVSRDLDRFRTQIRRAGQELESAARSGQTSQWSEELARSISIANGQAQDLLSALRDYERQWGALLENVKQIRAEIGSEITEWDRFRRRVDEYGQDEKSALGTLNGLTTGIQELKTVLETVRQRLESYHAAVLETALGIKGLVGRSQATVRRVDEHLDDRERALAKSRQDADRFKNEYYRRVERERTRVQQEIEQLRFRQERLGWVARDPASIIDELAGCSAQTVSKLRGAPLGARAREMIVDQVAGAIESVRSSIDVECERRIDALRAARQFADGALQIQSGSCGEADLLLVPIWYVEWRRTLDPEKPERKRYCYRLETPLEIAFRDGKRIQGELYPALTRYLRELPGLGEWEGEFSMGREPAGKLAAEIRRHACLQDREIEALVADMREAVAQHIYPPGYDEMVEKSRDDLGEWQVRGPQSGREQGSVPGPRRGAGARRRAPKGRE